MGTDVELKAGRNTTRHRGGGQSDGKGSSSLLSMCALTAQMLSIYRNNREARISAARGS